MLTLYITRHGETEWNIQNRMQGWSDSELTQKGTDNAISLGNRLKDVNLTAIYSSPSRRTAKTSELICGGRDIPIILNDNLKEINMGDWEGKTQTVIKDNYPNEYQAFWEMPHLFKPCSGESFDTLMDRVICVFDKILLENKEGSVLVVTHTVVIKAILSYFKKLPLEKLWEPPYIKDTSLTIVEIANAGDIKIKLEGCTLHTE
ncbi:histidine phosphatase family protein [Paenibacillus sp. N3.4]|uniref:histidine phosphatase family protein n=1 Tax=Paenibacillus sp. N3.4 TaxID=2603222 RepID=UPI0011CA8B1F|nr:histidine phosphatase family protein [Paenibacillus sp. N3.4]TXK83446.1 histidine phosphatase family protein [Paenibacillus sp. N3.4]